MWLAVIVVAIVVGTVMIEASADGARLFVGVAIGVLAVLVIRLFSQLRRQTQQLQALEARVRDIEPARRSASERTEVSPDKKAEASPRSAEPSPPSTESPPPAIESTAQRPRPEAAPSAKATSGTPAYDAWASDPERGAESGATSSSPAPAKPSHFDLALRWVRRWLTTGNVPVKVGVLISFFGIAFLLKYASEQNYLRVPIEWRLCGIGLAALGALYFGWRQRARRPAFSLGLQGGAIGVLFLLVFAAFHTYALLPVPVAFGLLLGLTVAAGVLALLQNAMALAVLAVVGGFLAPVLISTGGGSHIALFSYYALLNGAVFGLAWLRPWRVLNLIGFVFTFVIGIAWGYQYYQPEYFASVEPFLVLFFLMYLGISLAYALGRSIQLRSYVDSSLVFGLPLVVFPLQRQLVEPFEHGTALSAVALAVVYLAAATALLRSPLRARVHLLGEAYIALGVGFATLAVPLSVSAHWTALTWALEGAAMVWLGGRQSRRLPSAAGVALQFAAGLAFLYSLLDVTPVGKLLFLNDRVLGGVVLALAGLASARWLERNGDWFKGSARSVVWLLFGWGLLWWFGTLASDILRVVSDSWTSSAWVLLLVSTAAAMTLAQRYLMWHKLQVALSAYLPALLVTAAACLDRWPLAPAYFVASGGWLAWPLALFVLAVLFRVEKTRNQQSFLASTRPWQRAMTLWLVGVLILNDLYWAIDRLSVADIWAQAALIVAAVGFHAVVWRLWRRGRFESGDSASSGRDWSLAGVGPILALAAVVSLALLLTSSANPAPFFYLPLLNPLALSATAAVIATAHWACLNRLPGEGRKRLIGAGLSGYALLLITGEVTRTVHHWTGVPFQADALFASVQVQASLSVVWALAALAAMVFGHRRSERLVYLLGAGLMAVVVAKLFLVDLSQSDTLERIVSFIGVGLLLLAVGFLAPVPPKQNRERMTLL